MGADVYLRSISDAARERFRPHFDNAVSYRNAHQDRAHYGAHETACDACVKAQAMVDETWQAMYPAEGVFRDVYNPACMMSRYGFSWLTDIGGVLDEDARMHPDDMRELRNRLGAADFIDPEQRVWDALKKSDAPDDTQDDWRDYWEERRERFLLFLDHAIALEEPLYCSI